jgi:outer membrane protein insertion porin family/translocation and assembly module TamA
VLGRFAIAALAVACAGCLQEPYVVAPCARPDLTGCHIEGVTVTGNHEVPADAIRDKIATSESSHVFGGAFEHLPILGAWDRLTVSYEKLDPFVLARDLARVERIYRARGYYDAHARAARVTRDYQGQARVEIVVVEGAPVLIGEVKLDWQGEVTEKARALVQSILHGEDKPHKPFDEDTFEDAKRRIHRALTDSGYAYARITGEAQVDLVAHLAHLTYTLTPGPACTFGAVSIEGYGELPESKLLQAIDIKEGHPYSTDRIESAQNALSSLRVLGSVEAVPQLTTVGERATVIPIVFKVTRTDLRTLKGGVGAEVGSKVEVHGVAGWENRNFLGGLRHFSVEAKPGLVVNPLSVGTLFSALETPLQPLIEVRLHSELVQPGFIEARTDGLINLAANLTQLQPLDTLGYFELAGKTGVHRDFWGGRVQLGLFFNMSFDQPTQLDNYAPINDRAGYHRLVLPYLQSTAVLDLRTNEKGKRDPLNPHQGFYLSNDVQMAFVDSQDVRIRPEARGYIPISKRVVLALRGTFGFLDPFGGDLAKTPNPGPYCPYGADPANRCIQAPGSGSTVDRSRYIQVLQIRGFNSGGPQSNRGYSYSGVGPQEFVPHISPVQSNHLALPIATDGAALWEASAELRFPVFGQLGGELFVDSSDVEWHLSDLGAPFAPHLSSGLGLRYLTPVGPFRIDFGVRIPGAQVLGIPNNKLPVYDPTASPACISTSCLDPKYGQSGSVVGLPLAISLAIGDSF